MAATRLSRKEKQEQTRAAILDAATTLFATRGVEGTSVEAIARAAGLTQGAIYSNFASKADLWWAIADETSRTVTFDDFFRGDRSLAAELRRVGRALWRVLQEASRTELLLAQEFDLFLMRNRREQAKYVRGIRESRDELAAVLTDWARRRGERLPLPAPQLARAINVASYGLLHMFMLDPEAVDESLCVATVEALATAR